MLQQLYLDILLTIDNTHDFTTRMHRQLRHTNINGTNARARTNNGTNGGATGTVVANDKFLNGQARCSGNFANNESSDGIGGVPLIRICFDNDATIEFGSMV